MQNSQVPTKKKRDKIIGYVISPLLYTVYFLLHDPSTYNWTGLLSNPETSLSTTLVTVLFGIDLFVVLIDLGKKYQLHHYQRYLIVLFILCVLCIIFPYTKETTWLSQIHLLSSLSAFIFIHIYLIQLHSYDIHARNIYMCFLFLSVMCMLNAWHIDGYSEIVFVIGIRWYMTMLQTK